MRLFAFIFLLLISTGAKSQHTVSGNLSPAKSFKWLMVYHLNSNGQSYVTDTAVKDGHFEFTLSNSVSPGMYRVVYAVPQDTYYIDFIYNCEEDIVFNFDLESGLNFVSSIENKLYNSYFSEIDMLKNRLMDFYQKENPSEKEYKQITDNLKKAQTKYEEASKGTIANHFIKANKHYLPEKFLPLNDFLKEKKEHYFDAIDFTDGTLQSSDFFSDKILSYIFWAIPPDATERDVLVKAINENVTDVASKLGDIPLNLKVQILDQAWTKASNDGVYEVSDYIFDNYLKGFALEAGNNDLVAEIETNIRLRIGAVSPEITWKENGATKSLSALNGASKYVLVFWSSTCSHCLNELPGLHKELQKFDGVKVVAVGLEDSTENWQATIPRLSDFHHAIALGKWESEYAKTFAIQKTPTYFILDNNKRFIAKPESAEEVIDFLKKKS
ncbi:TlpA disulfide reductase family protein [Maribacter thermophilus]|uniref:TlpA disulfide reductase family protein n=1 Tax=Maribacter thermophilus TaxID=1197874 RepID=UPI0006416895|nr:TlpA disulfide reductase family protein [Maribacter thermophilus]